MNDTEDSEGLPSLDKPGWYSQGNWPHLHELLKTMTGKPEPKVNPSIKLQRDRLRLTLRLTLIFGRGLNGKSALGDSQWCELELERGSWQACGLSGGVPAKLLLADKKKPHISFQGCNRAKIYCSYLLIYLLPGISENTV